MKNKINNHEASITALKRENKELMEASDENAGKIYVLETMVNELKGIETDQTTGEFKIVYTEKLLDSKFKHVETQLASIVKQND